MTIVVLRRSAPVVINLAVTAICLFGSAGRLNWPGGWVLLGLSLFTGVAASIVAWRDPGLIAERRNLKAGKAWDKALVGLAVFLGPVAAWITAGLDFRHAWSTGISAWAFGGGMAAAVLGGALLVWAMRANTFFSAVVRIQNDRGHTVVRHGPYRMIRHPGYAGTSLFMLATPLILGSWWAFIPAAITVALTVVRTALEDRTLQNELAGYTEYTRTVKYRLLPFVW